MTYPTDAKLHKKIVGKVLKYHRAKPHQVQSLTGTRVKKQAGDRGYRGKKEINGTQILITDAPKTKDSYYQRKKKHKLFCKRAGIEPTIGHLKSDYRLGCNFYKGLFGHAINVMLAAATYNFKRAMKVPLFLINKISETLLKEKVPLKYAFKERLVKFRM